MFVCKFILIISEYFDYVLGVNGTVHELLHESCYVPVEVCSLSVASLLKSECKARDLVEDVGFFY